jgi:hypothetical protein
MDIHDALAFCTAMTALLLCATLAPGMACNHILARTHMQVSSRGLQQLLALPRLVEVNARAYCDDLHIPFSGDVTHPMQQRYDALSAAFTGLCSTSRLAGRNLTTKLIRHPTFE